MSKDLLEIKELLNNLLKSQQIEYDNLFLVGSVALGIELPSSDYDFVIGVDFDKKDIIKKKLSLIMEFRGERPATKDSTRLLFCIKQYNKHIDLNIMTKEDCHNIVAGMNKASSSITKEEKKQIIEKKKKLKNVANLSEYEEYKNNIYKIYCPEFLWFSDIELVNFIANQYINSKLELPDWLKEKLSKQS